MKNLKEAVEIANQSEFANGACLFTSNSNAIRYFRENIDAGMLGINLGVPAPMAFFPFSGWKSSFFGTLHANGKDSVDFYTRKRSSLQDIRRLTSINCEKPGGAVPALFGSCFKFEKEALSMSHLLRKPQANELSQGVKLVHEVKNRIPI